MKASEIDWSVLRGALILLGVTLTICAGLIGSGYYFQDDMHRAFNQEQRRFLSISQRYLAVDEEKRLINTYLPRYHELERRGVVGEELRLNWTERLREISARLKLPSLRYNIAPREPYDAPFTVQAGAFRIYDSNMKLSMGLVHEGDLFRLLESLEKEAPGTFTVRDCKLQRLARRIDENDPNKVNIRATCELLWLTLRKPTEDEP